MAAHDYLSGMNPHLNQLQPYPFERLAQLKRGIAPPVGKAHIALSIGEPQHPTPPFIADTLTAHRQGLNRYPTIKGLPELREAIATWLIRRYGLLDGGVDPDTQVLPCAGTREALFAFAQCALDPRERPLVLMPNPFYQIYEGATLLAGAEPYFLNTTRETGYLPDFDAVPDAVWARCRLIYICSPGNPTGAVINGDAYRRLLELSERHGFIIASDECYSELYADESAPPPGLLQSACARGNTDFRNCIVFNSLSKRSNAPGLRSGFVAGDADLLRSFQLYRTYHGCALSLPIQQASLRAWQDESHVADNRALYRQKFAAVYTILKDSLEVAIPPAGFFLWSRTRGDDQDFARELYAREHVTVLPGSYLSREAHGVNPGRHHVRMALVAPLEDCVAAAERIREFVHSL
jgi:N-succinyldiaminopimelate aminotransferase